MFAFWFGSSWFCWFKAIYCSYPLDFWAVQWISFCHSFISRLSTHKFREKSKFFLFHIKKYFKIKSLFYALLCTSVSVENLCSWFVKIFQEALDNSSAVSASQFTLNCFVLLLLFFPDALSKTSALFHLVLTWFIFFEISPDLSLFLFFFMNLFSGRWLCFSVTCYLHINNCKFD